MRDLLVFDMDGVLVDVTDSYRETIRQTVAHFTGKQIAPALIQDYKNAGGWNNDWALSQKIAADLGVDVSYDAVVDRFQRLFLGENGAPGLIERERWLAAPGLFERLGARFDIAVFTGRPRDEAWLTLRRFASEVKFDPVLCDGDVACGKPAPDGLLEIKRSGPARAVWYIGDTVDDARCARAAQVPFIGIAAAHNTRREEVIRLFKTEAAVAVLTDINELETFFASR
jgi:HAD superfamily phosphatase